MWNGWNACATPIPLCGSFSASSSRPYQRCMTVRRPTQPKFCNFLFCFFFSVSFPNLSVPDWVRQWNIPIVLVNCCTQVHAYRNRTSSCPVATLPTACYLLPHLPPCLPPGQGFFVDCTACVTCLTAPLLCYCPNLCHHLPMTDSWFLVPATFITLPVFFPMPCQTL